MKHIDKLRDRWTQCSCFFVATTCVLAGVTVVGLTVDIGVASANEACGNQSRRFEQESTALPDCRAYEMVTPAQKESDEPTAVQVGLKENSMRAKAGVRASETGERIAWTSEYVFPNSASPGLDYLSMRGPDKWSSENVIPPQSVENGVGCPLIVGMAAYSSDLSNGLLADGFGQPGSGLGSEGLDCGHDEPLLVPGEPQGFQNLFLRDNMTGAYQLVNVTPSSIPAPKPGTTQQYFAASFLAGSTELSHIVFEEELPLTENAPSGDDLYEWAGGTVRLVTFLKNGTPVLGRLAGSTRNTELESSVNEFVPLNIANFRHAVSGDGARIFFEAEGNLYVREDAATTAQVDESEGPGSSGGGKFMVASKNGSRVFFTAESPLTHESKAEAGKPDLYEYDLAKATGKRLTDVTRSAEPADVLGVAGASEDGSYLYFVAEAALTPAQETNSQGAKAEANHPNLYLLHEGVTTFVATLDLNNDSCDWMSPSCLAYPRLGGLTSRVSTNGEFIAFDSDESLTGYGNVGQSCVPTSQSAEVVGFTAGPCQEIFLYEAGANSLTCASCDTNGSAPVGPAVIRWPAGPSTDAEMRNAYPSRNVSDSGQVFFETKDPLVPRATDGRLNVYEYEGGKQYLLSSGTSGANSYFMDASVSGRDVFFATAQPLVAQDGDSAYDIYDARIDGGLQSAPEPPTPCQEESTCRSAASPTSAFSPPVSAMFVGPEPPVPTTAKVIAKRHKKKNKKKKRVARTKRKRAANRRNGKGHSRSRPVYGVHRGGAK